MPGQPAGQPLQQTLPLPSQPYLAQQSAAYAAAAQQAAPYVINPGQDAAQYMSLIAAGMPQYYGVAPWGVYPANLIPPQQGSQPRRPLTPSQQAAAENQPYQVNTCHHYMPVNSNINTSKYDKIAILKHHVHCRFDWTFLRNDKMTRKRSKTQAVHKSCINPYNTIVFSFIFLFLFLSFLSILNKQNCLVILYSKIAYK